MKSMIVLTVILAAVGITHQLPSTLTMQGIVRDFSAFHADFESPVNYCREQTGLYLNKLSPPPSSRPVPIPPQLRTNQSLGLQIVNCQQSSAPSLLTSTAFAISNFGHYFQQEYYQDIPGVNIAIPIQITLQLIDHIQGIYQYTAPRFFPINDRGFMREQLDYNNVVPSASRQSYNYWFTTEFRMNFYYRGGEIFSFLGDDDLWVFIDGRLTECDLGSIHIARPCTVYLDKLGLLPNSTYQMAIFHAERHYKGSSFQLTTSIVPINQAPIVNDFTVVLLENSVGEFELQGYDPDYNPNLQFMILSQPQNGTLSVETGVWLPYDTRIQYTPEFLFHGTDKLAFLLNDQQANSSTASVKLIINAVDVPPLAFDQTVSAVYEQQLTVMLQGKDLDSSPQDLQYYLISTPSYGYFALNKQSGELNYTAASVGTEVLEWRIYDGTDQYATAFLTVQIDYGPDGPPGTLKPTQVAGIVVGGVVFFALISLVLAYVLYYYLAAAKFERTWAEEFYSARMIQNPLFKQATKEHFNPLYNPRSSSMNLMEINETEPLKSNSNRV